MVGWGQTEAMLVSDVLMEAQIPIVPTALCRNHSELVKDGFHVCAGGEEMVREAKRNLAV